MICHDAMLGVVYMIYDCLKNHKCTVRNVKRHPPKTRKNPVATPLDLILHRKSRFSVKCVTLCHTTACAV